MLVEAVERREDATGKNDPRAVLRSIGQSGFVSTIGRFSPRKLTTAETKTRQAKPKTSSRLHFTVKIELA